MLALLNELKFRLSALSLLSLIIDSNNISGTDVRLSFMNVLAERDRESFFKYCYISNFHSKGTVPKARELWRITKAPTPHSPKVHLVSWAVWSQGKVSYMRELRGKVHILSLRPTWIWGAFGQRKTQTCVVTYSNTYRHPSHNYWVTLPPPCLTPLIADPHHNLSPASLVTFQLELSQYSHPRLPTLADSSHCPLKSKTPQIVYWWLLSISRQVSLAGNSIFSS